MTDSQTTVLPAHSLDLRSTPWFDSVDDQASGQDPLTFNDGGWTLYLQPGLAPKIRRPQTAALRR